MATNPFPKQGTLQITGLPGGYNSRDADLDVEDTQLSGGQNVDIAPDSSVAKRKGHTLYGNFMGPTTGVLGLVAHEPQGGTAELLAVYDTVVNRYVAGVWTALTSVTMTTNKAADSAYFPLTSKTYIVNQTDNVVKYTSGTSGDQSDGSFKKGKYIVQYKNRLIVANVSSQEDYLWYTDLGVDTFSSNNYLRAGGEVTGLEVIYDRLLTFTKRKLYFTQNFSFNGVAAGPEQFTPLPTDYGAIYDRTIAKVNGLVYFLGQSAEGIAAIYATDGTNVSVISDPIAPDLASLAPGQLTSAAAVGWGRFYRISVAASGQTSNTLEYLWDTVNRRWLPPYTNTLGGFSCYVTFESSGQLDAYAGTQGKGLVYKLNQQDYDEETRENFTTVGAVDTPVDASPAKRGSQSFKLSNYATTDTVTVNSVSVRLKKNAGTTTDLQVRIETDLNGLPSGTLADSDATATITAFSSTSYTYYKASFTNVTLSGNTTYWVVIKHITEGSGSSQYYWSGNSSGTYTRGNLATYQQTTSSSTQNYSPDAYPTSTSVDGYANASNASGDTFANMRSSAGNTAADFVTAAFPRIMLIGSNLCSDITRCFFLFDTSSIPNDAVITSATLSLYNTFVQDDLAQSVGITSGIPTSNTALVAADYASSHFGSTRFATDVALAGMSTNAYVNFALNASGLAAIDVAGVTKFGVRLSGDIDGVTPTYSGTGTKYSSASFLTSEYGSPRKPTLSVTYSSVTGSAVWTSTAGTDQNFLIFSQGDINGYADTKAFQLAPTGQKFHHKDTAILAKASGTYPLQIGINTGEYAGFDTQDLYLSSGGATLGSTFVIGSSVLGGQNRVEGRLRFPAVRGRTAKFRFGTRKANQPFTVYRARTDYEVINKLK